MPVKFADHHDISPVAPCPGVQRCTTVWGKDLMLLYNTFRAGAAFPEHAHPEEQITYVLSGKLIVSAEGQTYALTAGQCLLFPADVPHGLTAQEDTVVLDLFSPPREDFK